MDRAVAEEIIAELRKASDLCEASLRTVMSNETPGHAKVMRNLVGQFMGNAYLNVLAPLWKTFPDLEPPEMRQPYSEPAIDLSPASREAIRAFLRQAHSALELIERAVPQAEQDDTFQHGGVPEVEEKVAAIESFLDNPRVTK